MPNTVAPLAYDVGTAARRLGLGRTTTYSLIKTGALRSFKVGSSRRVSEDACREFIAALEKAQQQDAG